MIEIEKIPEKIKILILEGHKIKRMSWQNSLMNYPYLDIIGVVGSEFEALYLMEDINPDIIIIDLVYIGAKGLNIISNIKQINKNAKIIVLSNGKDNKEIIDALTFGVNAFGVSEIEPESLALIIKTVAKGACWFDPIAASAVMSYFPKQKDIINNEEQTLTPLSEREKEVLRLLVKGKSNTAIAKELIVSVHTAKAHVCNIFQKMKVTDRVQAAVKAVNFNLI